MRKEAATTKQWLSDYRYKAGCKKKNIAEYRRRWQTLETSAWMNPKKCGGKAWKNSGKTANKRRYLQSWGWTIFLSALHHFRCDADCCIFLCIICRKLPTPVTKYCENSLISSPSFLRMGKLWNSTLISCTKSQRKLEVKLKGVIVVEWFNLHLVLC